MRIFIQSTLLILIFLAFGFDAVGQGKVSKKQQKRQQEEALASRLFIDGQRFLMLEDYDRAYFYFQKAREKSPDEAAINFKIAEILLRANRTDEALGFGLKAVELDPDNKYYNLVMAEVYSKQNQPLKAAEILENLMANSDQNQNYILDLASLYLAAGEFDKALTALDRAEEYYGTVAPLTLQKQRIYLRKNNLTAAVEEGKKLVDAYPGNSEYVLNLVEILFNNGRTDEAIALVEGSLRAYPNQPELQMAAYALYKEKSEVDRAELLIIDAFANPDLDPKVKSQAFAEILQEPKSERRDALLDKLSTSMMAHHANDASVLTVAADKKMIDGNQEEALELYKKSTRLDPSNPQVMQAVITNMFELGQDFSEIESFTEVAVEEFPDRPEFWFFDGTAKLAQNKGQESVASLEKALEINAGKNPQLTLLVNGQLGDAYHQAGKKQEAFAAYEAVLALNPTDPHVLNNYAYFLSLAKENLDKAKTMSEGLVKKFPKNATYLDTHAWVLFQLGDYDNAKIFMERAIKYDPNPSGVIWEHYGDILYHLGQKNEALTYWKKAEGADDVSDNLTQKIKDRKYHD